jgi:serine protease
LALRSRPAENQLHWSGDLARLHDDSEPDAERLSSQLSAQAEVEFAQPNYIRKRPAWTSPSAVAPLSVGPGVLGKPNDPDYSGYQWNFSLLNMPAAWDINPGGSSLITVAVIDTGVTVASSTLSHKLWTGQKFETVSLRFAGSPDLSSSRFISPLDYAFDIGSANVRDFDGHGTHVASTIAEDANNQLSLAGMAYKVRIMPVKVCTGFWELMLSRADSNITGYPPTDSGGCSDEAIAQGIMYAVDNGARVLNISLGGSAPAPAIRNALAYAVGKGAFVAIAVGNEGDSGNVPEYPAAYAPGIDGVMSVGAIGKSKTRAYYSSTGSQLEIAAPGGSDRDGGGLDKGFVWQVTLIPDDSDPLVSSVPRFDRYSEIGYIGTSMATPHIAATAALLMSQGVTSPKAIEAIIKASALDLGSPGRDDEYGYGLVQPRTALFGLGISK